VARRDRRRMMGIRAARPIRPEGPGEHRGNVAP